MATATKTIKGFTVTCPYCGDADATVKIDLGNLQAVTCGACDEEFSPRDAVDKATEQLRQWTAVLRWTEMAGAALAASE